jgi:VanZ family protein
MLWIYVATGFLASRGIGTTYALINGRVANSTNASRLWDLVSWFAVRGFHVFQFAILVVLLLWAFNKLKHRPLFAGAVALLYAATDEMHRTYLLQRPYHLTTFTADAFGVVLGIWIFVRMQIKGDKLAFFA